MAVREGVEELSVLTGDISNRGIFTISKQVEAEKKKGKGDATEGDATEGDATEVAATDELKGLIDRDKDCNVKRLNKRKPSCKR